MKISTIVFPVQDGKIFLANKKRGFGAGFLNGYGGKKQPEDATVEDTAARELSEEAGIEAKELEKVAVIEFYEEKSPVFECHIFFCSGWTGEFKESEEMTFPQAYDISNVPYDKMWDADRVWLPLVCAGQKIKAVSIYNKGMTKQENFEYEKLY